ncbi:hypothetical protein E2C01_073207 [Portunus trituberculatus]|uniref:Uncharacterized protein n=1 Tax=Portunus trituberculatus TaxID=210409 RepID=A0A5B7I276_PORTR|nr:hypothetical protein [Portunus trituberculatus]
MKKRKSENFTSSGWSEGRTKHVLLGIREKKCQGDLRVAGAIMAGGEGQETRQVGRLIGPVKR